MWQADWDGDFVVGGESRLRLTPNFRLFEFFDDRGEVRVHRELVSALQMLRDQFGAGLSVRSVSASGLSARVAPSRSEVGALERLNQAAVAVAAHELFSRVEAAADEVEVAIPPDDERLPIGLEQALQAAFSVTSGFETSGDKFQQVTGNFDGAGLSFGPAQVNFKTKTLPPLFAAFREADEGALRNAFDDSLDWEEFAEVLALSEQPGGVARQIEWANSISTGSRLHDVVEPWKSSLRAVGRVPRFREIMVESILRDYGAKLLRAVAFLKELRPDLELDHLRCMCSLYDLVIQQGSLDKAHTEIRQRVETENPADQFELVAIAVEERGKKANERWVSDCISRRLGVLRGVPVAVEETQRANVSFYLLRDVRIRDAEQIATQDVTAELVEASQNLASGGVLLV